MDVRPHPSFIAPIYIQLMERAKSECTQLIAGTPAPFAMSPSWLDPHVLKYDPPPNPNEIQLKKHVDSVRFSGGIVVGWNVMGGRGGSLILEWADEGEVDLSVFARDDLGRIEEVRQSEGWSEATAKALYRLSA